MTGRAGVLLARHGRTPYNVERRFQGQTEVPLDDVGREQAAQLARTVAEADVGIARLVCSPLRRARETADVVGAAVGLEPEPDARLMETDTGDWTDRLFADVEREDPDGYAAYHATDAAFGFPGGETLADQQRRVLAALRDAAAATTPALVVCHRGVIRCARAEQDPRGLAAFMSFDVPNGSMEPW